MRNRWGNDEENFLDGMLEVNTKKLPLKESKVEAAQYHLSPYIRGFSNAGLRIEMKASTMKANISSSKLHKIINKTGGKISDSQIPDVPNFWDVGAYKRIVKRVDDGRVLASELGKLMHERSEIERRYANMLETWSDRWQDRVENCIEFPKGTLFQGWMAMLDEAKSTSQLHREVADRILEQPKAELSQWKKDNFTKSMMKWKETKAAEDMFNKAQKPWAKLMKKVEKTRKTYHSACEAAQDLDDKIYELERDDTVSKEELVKLKDKLFKAKNLKNACRQKYKQALAASSADEARYTGDMKESFQSCQQREEIRVAKFKGLMQQYQEIIAIDPLHNWETLEAELKDIDEKRDTVTYTEMLGPGMKFSPPGYYEYGETEPTNLVQVVMNPPPVEPDYRESSENGDIDYQTEEVCYQQPRKSNASEDDEDHWVNESVRESADMGEDYDSDSMGRIIPEEERRLMRALYDYTAEEPEEISLAVGDIITQIEEEDEQGWCRGIHRNGTVGLYPANYVEAYDAELDDEDLDAEDDC